MLGNRNTQENKTLTTLMWKYLKIITFLLILLIGFISKLEMAPTLAYLNLKLGISTIVFNDV